MADIDTDTGSDAQPLTNLSSKTLNDLVSAPASSCPCCVILPNDLFLPTSPLSSNSHTDNTAITSSNSNSNSKGESHADNERSILTPQQVYQELVEKSVSSRIQIVDTHCHAHLERPSEELDEPPSFYHCSVETDTDTDTSALPNVGAATATTALQFVSLTCAVEPSDWSAALEYAAQSPYRIAAIGIHPWYLASAEYDPDHPDSASSTSTSTSTPTPIYLQNLEQILKDHPHAAVGEIGLCKMARWTRQHVAGKKAALGIQRHVFSRQLRLAAQYQRPVTIHCVDQQKILLEVLRE
jgi:Tat protein secretion system quality control protein TatD with DNase activity